MSEYTHKLVDGVRVDLTQEEIDELEARDRHWESKATERLLKGLRLERNELLKESDFTQLADYPKQDAALWRTYRQSLRDLPASQDWTGKEYQDIVWPAKPGA